MAMIVIEHGLLNAERKVCDYSFKSVAFFDFTDHCLTNRIIYGTGLFNHMTDLDHSFFLSPHDQYVISVKNFDELSEWCSEYLQLDFMVEISKNKWQSEASIHFQTLDDATIFKLRWL